MNWESLVFVDANASALQTIGVSLVHFAWQGIAIAAAAALALSATRSARVRYAIGIAGMVLMIAAPLATFALLRAWAPPAPRWTATSATNDATASNGTVAPIQPTGARSGMHDLAPPPTPQPALLASPTHAPLAAKWDDAPALLASAWLALVALLALRHAFAIAGLARLQRGAAPVTDPALHRTLRYVASAIGLRNVPPLLACDRVAGPCVVGVLKPAVLWPVAVMSGLTPSQVEAILAHELAHVRRLDPLVNHLQTLVETLFFFHPCVWWLGRRVRAEREACCDALAADVLEGDRIGMADALIALAARQQSFASSPQFALGARDGTIASRVKRLLDADASTSRQSPVALAIAVVALLACVSVAVQANVDASSPTTAPAAPAATEAAAKPLVVGDRIDITIVDLLGPGLKTTSTAEVNPEGFVRVELLGDIAVQGLSPSDAARAIERVYLTPRVPDPAAPQVWVTRSERPTGAISSTQPTATNEGTTQPANARAESLLQPGDTIELRLDWNDFSDPVTLGTFTIDPQGQINLPLRNGTLIAAGGKSIEELQTLLLKTFNEGRDVANARPILVRRVEPRPAAQFQREMPAAWLRAALDDDARLATVRNQLDMTDTELAVEIARNGERSRRARELRVQRDALSKKADDREAEVREAAREVYADRLRAIADGIEPADGFDWSTGRAADARGAESRTLRLQKQLDAIQIEIDVEKATGGDGSQRLKQLIARREAISVRLDALTAEEARQKTLEQQRAALRETADPRPAGDEAVARLRARVSELSVRANELRLQQAALRAQLGAGHPTVRRCELEIRATELALLQARRTLGVGEYYITGDIARPGVYSLTDRPVTLRQALIAAGVPVHDDAAIVVRRRDVATGDEQSIERSARAVLERADEDFALLVDDQVIVRSVAATTQPMTQSTTEPASSGTIVAPK